MESKLSRGILKAMGVPTANFSALFRCRRILTLSFSYLATVTCVRWEIEKMKFGRVFASHRIWIGRNLESGASRGNTSSSLRYCFWLWCKVPFSSTSKRNRLNGQGRDSFLSMQNCCYVCLESSRKLVSPACKISPTYLPLHPLLWRSEFSDTYNAESGAEV